MRSSGPISTPTVQSANDARPGHQEVAAQGQIVEPISAASPLSPALSLDSLAEASGRQILSTAFVRVGADGYMTVELRDGRILVLRNVLMRSRKYCGDQGADGQYCGGYADVVAARPGNSGVQPPATLDAGRPAPVSPDRE